MQSSVSANGSSAQQDDSLPVATPPLPSLNGLVAGLLVGLLATMVSVLLPNWAVEENLQLVATVNDTPISREKYLNHLRALGADRKDKLTEADAEYVLQRIIEEELLVQRGVEVGLLDSDKRTRAAMVNAMISMTTATAEASVPTEDDLQTFFEDNIDYFTPTSRLRVRQLVVAGGQSEAQLAYERLLAGESFTQVNNDLGKSTALILPNVLLPPVKVREYLGPKAVQLLQPQVPGFVSRPQQQGKNLRILVLQEKEAGAVPELHEVHEQVEAEYVRRSGDEGLREYLQWLKGRADILYPSQLPLIGGDE